MGNACVGWAHLVIAAVVAGGVVWFVMWLKSRAARELAARERKLAEDLRAENEKRVQGLIDGALAKFQSVSNAALKANGDDFQTRNLNAIEQLLRPLRESVKNYEDAARKSQIKSAELELKMGEHMKSLGLAAEKFNANSTNFVNAITGGNKVAGNWGEAVLDQLLADCGLMRDVHYIAQTGGTGNIPDYQVFDAASQKILVIDAKVSWKKFKEMAESEDPAIRAAALAEHIESIRRQIDNLSSKKYHENPNPPRVGYRYLPFSAMFVPSDAALWEAVKSDPTLPAYAYRKSVALVTPTSLLGFMRLVHEGWSLYNTQRNQEEIARQANLLVERVDRLFKNLEEAEAAQEKAREKLTQAMKLAASDGSCIKGPALKIIRLRERADKVLKSKALQDDRAEEDAAVIAAN